MNISILSILFIAMLATSMAFRVNMKTKQDNEDTDICGLERVLDLCEESDPTFCVGGGWCCVTGSDCLHIFMLCTADYNDPYCPWNSVET